MKTIERENVTLYANELLDELIEFREYLRRKENEKEEKLEELLTREQRKAKQRILDEYEEELEPVKETIELLEQNVRDAVLLLEESLTNNHLVKAIYVRPGVKWDNQQLRGYAVAHPEILEFSTATNAYTRLQYKDNDDGK